VRQFAYRLALALGEWDVDGLLRRMTWRQLRGWMAYYRTDPWGGERDDLHAGIVAATIANVYRGKARAYKPSDFMPQFQPRPRRTQTKDEALGVLMAIAKAHNEALEHDKGR
jgi:hypothetical protein